MGLYVQQNENRSELQQRLDAELRQKAQSTQKLAAAPDADHETAYLEGTKSTTSLAWVWVLVVIALIALAIYFIVRTANQY